MTTFSCTALIAAWMGILYFLPGLLILRALRIRPLFLPAFALSYSLLVLVMLPVGVMGGSACSWGVLVCSLLFVIAALAWLRAPRYDFPRIRRFGKVGTGWMALMAIVLCYLAYAGAYTEVPADVYAHLGRVQEQVERLACNEATSVSLGRNILGSFQTRHAYWLHALLCRLSGASVAGSVLPIAVFNTLMLGSAFYFLALTVVARRRLGRSVKVGIAVLAAVLTMAHQGVGVFAYVRYYTFGPAFLNFVIYLTVIAGFVRWLRAERGAGWMLPWLPGIGLAMFVVHVQEALFAGFMIWAVSLAQAGFAAARRWRNGGAWRAADRRAAWTAALCTLIYLAIFAWLHMTRPSSPLTGDCVALGVGNMMVFDVRGNCLLTMGAWGLAVYALAILYGRAGAMPFLAGGMLIPFLTWLNPLTVDMMLRFTPSAALVFYRAGYLIPIGLMAAIMAGRAVLAIFSPRSGGRARAVAALVMACLVVFLFPIGSEGMTGRWTTLRRTPVEHDWLLWRDVVDYVRTCARGRQVVTDPVTTYMLRPMAGAQVMNRDLALKRSVKGFNFRGVLSQLDSDAGCLLVINRRDGAESETWTSSGHWPADILKVSRWYSPAACAGISARPDIFRMVWQADRVEVYEVDLRLQNSLRKNFRRGVSSLRWTCINVNAAVQQGDAHLLDFGDRTGVMIDVGHASQSAIVLSALRAAGIRRLRSIMITHGHPDHYGGMPALLGSGIAVDEVLFNPPTPAQIAKEEKYLFTPEEKKALGGIVERLKGKGFPWMPLTNGLMRVFGDVSFRVVYVIDGNVIPIGTADINDTSAVIRMDHRDVSVLFTADLSEAVGQRIISSPLRHQLQATVLKAPHHGAEGMETDSFIMAADSFFDAVDSRSLVVPAPEWLWASERCERIRKWTGDRAADAYVNGIDGDITVVSDGRNVTIKREKQGQPQKKTPLEFPEEMKGIPAL